MKENVLLYADSMKMFSAKHNVNVIPEGIKGELS